MAIGSPAVVTAPQIAAMDASQRAAYFNSLSPDQRAQKLAEYRAYQTQMNRSYLRNTVRKQAVCPQSSGGALIQTYSPGATLNYTVPSAQNAFLEGFLVRMALNYTLASGTSAVYGRTAGAPLSLIDNIILQYNGVQARFYPYILRSLALLSGKQTMPWPNSVLSGQHLTTIDNYLSSGNISVTTGSAQTATYEFYVPLNALHPQDARGLLPIMGGETSAQVVVTCAPQAVGSDPRLNTFYPVSGSGHAVTFNAGSTVQIIAVYRDGTSYLSPSLLGLDLSGIGTVQYQVDVPLTNLQAGQIQRQKISIMDQLYYVILTVIDGQQSDKFATINNIQILEAEKDSVGANLFWKYGVGTNISVNEYFAQLRGSIPGVGMGQDLDEGIVPLVFAPVYMEADPDNQSGTHFLNTSITGWTDFHYGIQLGAVGAVNGINPRVEAHVIYVNSAGLINA